MKGKQLHDFLFELYDFVDSIGDQIQPEPQDSAGAREQTRIMNANRFLTMVFVEWFFDRHGRQLLVEAAKEAGDLDPHASLSEGHRRIDLLRLRLDTVAREYNLSEEAHRVLAKLADDVDRTLAAGRAAANTQQSPQ